MTAYYIGLSGSREPHPLSPEGGFWHPAHAVLWANERGLPPTWWPYSEDERDAQPCRVGGAEA